jgi:hypothetical protein
MEGLKETPMSASHARRSVAPPSAVATRAAAVLSAAAAKLSVDQQRRLVKHKAALPDLVAKVLAQLDEDAEPADRIILAPRGPVEVSQGEGLGELLTLEEGRRRVHDYALATGTSFESWSGATAGPVDLAHKLGVSRSTLHAWQTKRLAIGLLNGLRKTVFPLEQFVDGKPVAGIADVLAVIGEPRVAWMWLKEPSPLLSGATPLARLKRGHLDEVLRAAQTNFGQ